MLPNSILKLLMVIALSFSILSCTEKEKWEDTPRKANRYCVLNNTNSDLIISTQFRAGKQLQNEVLSPNERIQISWYRPNVEDGYYFPGIISKIIIENARGIKITQECEFRFWPAIEECYIQGTIFDPSSYTTEGKRESIYSINEEFFDE